MSELKPKRIIVHCGLHKIGSTYLQRNSKSRQATLLKHKILYLSPTTFKKELRLLWKNLQRGVNKTKPSQKLKLHILKSLNEQAGDSPGKIHTIPLSFEAIFRTIRTDSDQKNQDKNSNHENNLELNRYSKKRTKRLICGPEHTFRTKDIDWTICLASRHQDNFIRSCNIQLIKEGHELSDLSVEYFTKISNFLDAKTSSLLENLRCLRGNRKIKIHPFSYDDASDRSNPIIYLKHFIKIIMPEETNRIIPSLINNSESKNLHKNIYHDMSERGSDIGREARPIFTKQEWKLVRKFLEKNFVKSI